MPALVFTIAFMSGLGMNHLFAVTLLVADYDEAIAWFGSKLGFVLIEDRPMEGAKRWVMIAPSLEAQTRLVLARATGPKQTALIGQQMGGRVGFFLQTSDFEGQYQRMMKAGVTFRELPRHEPYGKVVVFEDCYGNGWDLLEPVAS
jgi:catechol 2,3-dioxygenase-like lactoylglutathione lyase family enzyme